MRRIVEGLQRALHRWSMTRYQRGRQRDARLTRDGQERLDRAREGIFSRGHGDF
jgi:hypothetical protein